VVRKLNDEEASASRVAYDDDDYDDEDWSYH